MSIILDIETVPRQCYLDNPPAEILPKLVNPDNFARPETKAKYAEQNGMLIEEWETVGKIKALSTKSFYAEPICVMWGISEPGEFEVKKLSIGNNGNIIQGIVEIILDNQPLITWNGKGFDLPVLLADLLLFGETETARNLSYFLTPKWDNDRHIDLMLLFEQWFSRPFTSLEAAASLLGVTTEHLYGEGALVYDWHQNGERGEIIKHCRGDVITTALIANWMGVI